MDKYYKQEVVYFYGDILKDLSQEINKFLATEKEEEVDDGIGNIDIYILTPELVSMTSTIEYNRNYETYYYTIYVAVKWIIKEII